MTSVSAAPRREPSLLDRAATRVALDGHDGQSGALLERIVLDDGTRLVAKHLVPGLDLAGRVTGDLVGREAALWEAGVLQRLPAGVAHAVVEVDRGEHTTIVMRDLGDAVLGWEDPIGPGDADRIVRAMTAMHGTFVGISQPWLCHPDTLVGAFHPSRLPTDDRETGHPLLGMADQGWAALADLVTAAEFDLVHDLSAEPSRVTAPAGAWPATLLHGDLWPVNVAFEAGQVVLLDWGLATAGPAPLDVALFLIGTSYQRAMPREAVLDTYRRVAGVGPTDDGLAWGLAATAVMYGWDLARAVVTAASDAARAARRDELDWWLARLRDAAERRLVG